MTSRLVFVRCASHRARERLLSLVGEDPLCYFRWADTASRGMYRIPAALLAQARQIPGITRLRDCDDVRECIRF